jgi:hypothetical protein
MRGSSSSWLSLFVFVIQADTVFTALMQEAQNKYRESKAELDELVATMEGL